MAESNRRVGWSTSTKIVVVVMILALGVYLLNRFREVITPLALAVILAYVIAPAVHTVQTRLHCRRVWAALLIYAALLALLVGIPLVLAPVILVQFQELDLDLRLVTRALDDLPRRLLATGGQALNLAPALDQLKTFWVGLTNSFVQRTVSLLADVLASLVWGVFILVISFYLVKDGERLRRWFEELPPLAYRDDYRRLREEINLVWAAFFRGQIVLAMVVAVLFTLAGWAIGLPFALALGLLAGLLEFLPSLGHAIWFAIAVVVALLQGSTWLPVQPWAFALLVVALHVVFQQVDLNFLIPRIIGRRVQLPPLVVILGIVAGAALAGVLGVALAAPTIASARILGRYVYANLLDQDPFPPSGESADRLPEPAVTLTPISES